MRDDPDPTPPVHAHAPSTIHSAILQAICLPPPPPLPPPEISGPAAVAFAAWARHRAEETTHPRPTPPTEYPPHFLETEKELGIAVSRLHTEMGFNRELNKIASRLRAKIEIESGLRSLSDDGTR